MRAPRQLRLLLRPWTLDTEQALFDMAMLLRSPRKVFTNSYFRHQTNGQWSRDDPAFYAALAALVAAGALVWGTVRGAGLAGTLALVLRSVAVDFLLTGAVLASLFHAVANRVIPKRTLSDSRIEWLYCFDVHCNAFFVLFVYLNVLQLFLLPLISRDNLASIAAGNALYSAAWAHYFLITFLGYSVFPNLKDPQWLLLPVFLVALMYVPLLLLRVSIARIAYDIYF